MKILSETFIEQLAVLRITDGAGLPFWEEYKTIFDKDYDDNLLSYFVFLKSRFKIFRHEKRFRNFEDCIKWSVSYKKTIPKDG